MWETIIGALLGWLPSPFQRKEKSEYLKLYEQIRFEALESLTMYSCYYTNPVDIAKTAGHQLPPMYLEGSNNFRSLAARLQALSETTPPKVNDMKQYRDKLSKVSECLIGLSNSFTTPYSCDMGERHLSFVAEQEKTIRELLGSVNRK